MKENEIRELEKFIKEQGYKEETKEIFKRSLRQK